MPGPIRDYSCLTPNGLECLKWQKGTNLSRSDTVGVLFGSVLVMARQPDGVWQIARQTWNNKSKEGAPKPGAHGSAGHIVESLEAERDYLGARLVRMSCPRQLLYLLFCFFPPRALLV